MLQRTQLLWKARGGGGVEGKGATKGHLIRGDKMS
jgi:hypothetical protein